jgi:hypothetical protein
MDLIYTNASRADQGVLAAYAFDLSFGEKENDFEMTLGADEPVLEFGAFAYIEGTEYGGIVDGMKTSTVEEKAVYTGRTWHGMLNSKIIEPDAGADYLTFSGDANDGLAMIIARLGLGDLFTVSPGASGININNYQFHRYCKGYDGIRDMLGDNGAKLKIVWENRSVCLSAELIHDYSQHPIDGDVAPLTVERYENKVNHLVCLGRGNLADREVIHLYVDQFGRIGTVKYFTGLDEVSDTYENSNVESSDELLKEGKKRLKELRDNDKAEISINENGGTAYDIGDIVGATEVKSGVSVSAVVGQKIVRINNGVVSTEYQAGG